MLLAVLALGADLLAPYHYATLHCGHAADGIPEAIFTEAALSFIGVGISPPTPSWGQMVGEHQQYLRS